MAVGEAGTDGRHAASHAVSENSRPEQETATVRSHNTVERIASDSTTTSRTAQHYVVVSSNPDVY